MLKVYTTENIRNLALIGHSGSGKTNLTKAMLLQSDAIQEIGHVNEKSAMSDFSKEERERGSSIGTSITPIEWRSKKFNIIDTPGTTDLIGGARGTLRVNEAVLMITNATVGVRIGSERMWKYTEEIDLPRIIFVNKINGENVNFGILMEKLENKFGKKVIPFSVPIGEGEDFVGVTDVIFQKGYKYTKGTPGDTPLNHDQVKAIERMCEEIAEVVAGADEVLMGKYFSGEKFAREDLLRGVTEALIAGDTVPPLVGSAEEGIGVDILLNTIINYVPASNHGQAHTGFRYESGEGHKVSPDEPYSVMVFETVTDPFVGKIFIFKALSSKIIKDTALYNANEESPEKMDGFYIVRGKERMAVDEIYAGDIGATTKLTHTLTDHTLCDKAHPVLYKMVKQPSPVIYYAIEPESKGDEEKISTSLHRLQEEGPSSVIERNPETKRLTIGGQESVQLDVILEKLKNISGIATKKVPFIIPYRETIKGKIEIQGKHKKQSGGAGQYGDVWIRFEPCDEHLIFSEEVFGGAVPKNYFPAVEKGPEEAMEHGILAGFPMTGVKATLYDESYHDVDSNEMSFKLAAALAYCKGIKDAKSILLEPIMKAEVSIPDEYLEGVVEDVNKRHGQILSMGQEADGTQVFIAEAPRVEMYEYAIDLRAMTQSRGSLAVEYARYEEVPKEIAGRIIADHGAE